MNIIDDTQRKALRTSGLLYLLMALSAPIGLLYVPSTLIVPGDAAATAEHIRASEWLFRIGMGSELFHQAIAVFLVLALYRLFKPVNEDHAKLLVVLGALVSVPIMFLNVVNEIAALLLIGGANVLSGFEQAQRESLALLFLRMHGQGINVASIFWGLWLFPFGMLIIRSGFIPRILGYLLFAAGFGYLTSASTTFLAPQYSDLVDQGALVLEMGELPIVFWMAYKGLRPG
ncbi:MAG: hypothetical protein A2X67_13155 [Ignavibacteria bacterium GWA2_55_11]|nr:MAG: hypothetical protein A2X67_13155 [Ignavibacteria bacterium GWA2_55_11]OGU64328.1 MAG: hypothetical protein A3C56_09455 [Ignavibacteria bacterium RIFCSPHIGHO2_02_FULL_56_12]OGU71084.1 MAG: hypothetical protein A3G43_10670 [Ignavibacteria bacterium RIFCSPLOWO2_12_FULL_56_21]OGU73648.1 MAG: hypothetical protein A3H45_13445 [Ignavibacteria bacterium RIFCSPLOWO2_02_FULL_55_14]